MYKKSLVLTVVLALIVSLIPVTAFADPGASGVDGDYVWRELAGAQVEVLGYTGTDTVITVPDTLNGMPVVGIASNALSGKNFTSVTLLDGVTYLGNGAFAGCTALTSITLPGSVETIGDGCFNTCTALESITLPELLESMGTYVFDGDTSLETVVMKNNLTTMGIYTFSDCTSLTNVTLSTQLTAIPDNAFRSCTSLQHITIPDSVNTIGMTAFQGAGLVDIDIPGGVETIGVAAFNGLTSLTGVTLHRGLDTISNAAFTNCSNIGEITIPDTVTTIEGTAFSNCTGLTEVTIEGAATNLSNTAFGNCTSLNKATILIKTGTITGHPFGGAPFSDGIYGFTGTTTETYANAFSITFHPLSKVTYDSQSGSDVPPDYAVTGETVDVLHSEPTRGVCTFGGWWTEEYGEGTQFTASTPVTTDITVYAKWTKASSAETYVNGTTTLTPISTGGSWSSDASFVELVTNGDGTATIKGLKEGTTQVTTKSDGLIEVFTVTIRAARWTDGLTYNAAYAFDGGSGTSGDPYIIDTELSLAQLAVNVNGGMTYKNPSTGIQTYFRLGDDLDLSGAPWIPIGSFDFPHHPFSGNFDGDDWIISNVTVDEPEMQGVGLFGYTEGAYIESLGVEDCDISGLGAVGGLVGFADEDTSIHNCYTTGTVAAVYDPSGPKFGYNGDIAGGLVGNYGNALSTIEECWSSADVDGDRFVGGLVGYCSRAHIKNSYATGDVGSLTSEAYEAGGFIGGCDQSVIDRCYATGMVIGTGEVGGFVGDVYSNGADNTFTNCYARGFVTSTYDWGWSAGGFAGSVEDADFYNCYSAGNVSFTAASEAYYIGGFVGDVNSNVTFTSCFFDTTVSGRDAQGNSDDWGSSACAGITGLTTANMTGGDALINAAKMDALDSGEGAQVAELPIWNAHTNDYPDFKHELGIVTYNSQGADTAASPEDDSTLLGNTIKILPSEPIKAGCTFSGWWTEVNGGGKQFTASTPVISNITVYAKWTKTNSVTIYVSGRDTLTPGGSNGTWGYDSDFIELTDNGNGTVSVKGLRAGTTEVTYSTNGLVEVFSVTIRASELPSTGQDGTLIYVFTGAAVIALAAALLLRKRAKARQ